MQHHASLVFKIWTLTHSIEDISRIQQCHQQEELIFKKFSQLFSGEKNHAEELFSNFPHPFSFLHSGYKKISESSIKLINSSSCINDSILWKKSCLCITFLSQSKWLTFNMKTMLIYCINQVMTMPFVLQSCEC